MTQKGKGLFTRPVGKGMCVPYAGTISDAQAGEILEIMQPAWWYDWGEFNKFMQRPGYIPMLWDGSEAMPPQADAFQEVVRSHPHRVWQFLNEGNRRTQANISPQVAFERLKSFISLAWDTGVEFQYAAPGIEMSPSGLRWAEAFFKLCRKHGLHAPAYLTMHCYLFDGRLQTEADWNDMWSEFEEFYHVWTPHTEIVISEVCAWNGPYDEQKLIMDLMHAKYSGDPRVVGWAWYSVFGFDGNPFPNSVLAEHDPVTDKMRLTPLGYHWMSLE